MKINIGDRQVKIDNAFGLLQACQQFPKHKEDFFQLTKFSEILNFFTRNISSFRGLIKLFPEHKEDFFQLTLKTPKVLSLFTHNIGSFQGLIKLFPEHKEGFFQLTLKTPGVLSLFTRNIGSFQGLIKLFPNHKKEFIKLVLAEPKVFKSVIWYPSDLNILIQIFPKEEVLQKKTVKEIQAALKSEAMIRQAAKLMHQNKYGPRPSQSGVFKQLPDVLNKKIAALIGNPDVHNEKESGDIVNDNYRCCVL